jgi:hypothetical protein
MASRFASPVTRIILLPFLSAANPVILWLLGEPRIPKAKIFIGSSTNGLPIAELIAARSGAGGLEPRRLPNKECAYRGSNGGDEQFPVCCFRSSPGRSNSDSGVTNALRYALDEQGRPYQLEVLTDGEKALRFVRTWPDHIADAAWVGVGPRHAFAKARWRGSPQSNSSMRGIIDRARSGPHGPWNACGRGDDTQPWCASVSTEGARDLDGVRKLAGEIFVVSVRRTTKAAG